MGYRHLHIIQFVVLCWTAGVVKAQQLNNPDDDNDVTGSSYFIYQRPTFPRDCQEVELKCSSNNSSGIHLIQPHGCPEPFEVYCDNANFQDWTVIQRRVDGSIDFNRDWNSYNLGFGFLSNEFWIGNEKLSYLTNQNKCQLLINMTNFNGSSFYVSYNMFRIGDGFSGYRLVNLGQYSGTAGDFITWCSNNIDNGNCSCQRTCADPHTCIDTCGDNDLCICPEGYFIDGTTCKPQEECGCYGFGVGVVPEGQFHASPGCTRRAICNNGQLTWDNAYSCDSNATCEGRDNIRQCYCNLGFTGDGIICISPPSDCLDIYNAGITDNGVYLIKPSTWPGSPFDVYCNMSDGGGWAVFQHREDGTVNFYRNWDTYKEGFGSADHEFWLGNDKIYHLTNQKRYTIRIDMVNRHGSPYYAKYDYFRISNESDLYRLTKVGAYSGNADDGSSGHPAGYALAVHRGMPFSTYDRDNDHSDSRNCARSYHGAWWYRNCYNSHLNGHYNEKSDGSDSVSWLWLPGAERFIKYTEMQVRPH